MWMLLLRSLAALVLVVVLAVVVVVVVVSVAIGRNLSGDLVTELQSSVNHLAAEGSNNIMMDLLNDLNSK